MLQEEKILSFGNENSPIKNLYVEVGLITEEVTFYNISVANSAGNSWVTKKRYSQLEELHNALKATFPQQRLPFPPKHLKYLVSHTNIAFLEERRVLLLNYFRHILKNSDICTSKTLLSFLCSDVITEGILPTFINSTLELNNIPEDQEVTDIQIPTTRVMSDHILYQIDVINSRKRKTFNRWTILKRFQQVFEMDAAVRATLPEAELSKLPELPKREVKLLQDHMDPDFIEMRRALLENYLLKMLAIPSVARNQAFLSFLCAV